MKKDTRAHRTVPRAAILFLGCALAFFVFYGPLFTRGDFEESQEGPPEGFTGILHTGPEYQETGENLGAQDFYVGKTGRWLSQGPEVVIREAIVPLANGPVYRTVFCNPEDPPDPNYVLANCSVSREKDALDLCNEGECGLIGVVPVDGLGEPITGQNSFSGARGCRAGIDGVDYMEGVIHAFCIKK